MQRSWPRLPKRVRLRLRGFLSELKRNYGKCDLYLFGSYARGDWLEDSDLDLIVVSDSFNGIGFIERISRLRLLAPRDIAVEILAYTPNEFKEKLAKSLIIKDASKYWVKIES